MLRKLIVMATLLASATAWAETTTSLTTGFDYSTGNYGSTTSTSILYIPVTAKYQTDDYYLKLTIPYIRVSSAGGVVRGFGNFMVKTGTRVTTQSGLGDVSASAGYAILTTDSLWVDLVGNIKFGTADASRNLGTGENDYSAQLDGFYTLDNTTLLATAGYKIIGAPVGVTVNNIGYGTIGFSQKTSNTGAAGMLLDMSQASSNTNPGTRELTFFISDKINKRTKVQLNLLKGFSDSSPNYGVGMMITGSF